MPPNRLTLHIGFHKTGTTSIQVALARHEAKLRSDGVYLPRAGRTLSDRVIHSNIGWEANQASSFDQAFGGMAELEEEVSHVEDCDRLVITDEGLSRLKDPASFLESLPVDNVDVLAYTRRIETLAPSLYCETLKFGRPQTFSEFLDKPPPILFHNRIATRWRRLSQSFKAVPIEATVGRQGVLSHFFGELGVQLPIGKEDSVRVNTRISMAEAFVTFIANNLFELDGGDMPERRAAAFRSKCRTLAQAEVAEDAPPFAVTPSEAAYASQVLDAPVVGGASRSDLLSGGWRELVLRCFEDEFGRKPSDTALAALDERIEAFVSGRSLTEGAHTISVWRCGDPDGPAKEATVLVVRAPDIADQQAELDDLLARYSEQGQLLYIVVIGQTRETIGAAVRSELTEISHLTLRTNVRVHSTKENARDKGLPMPLLRMLLALQIGTVRQVHFSGSEWHYRRKPGVAGRLLFVFPGPIFPINKGSHQRALNMLLALVRSEFDLTVVFAAASKRLHNRSVEPLSLIASSTDSFTGGAYSVGVMRAWLAENALQLLCRTGMTQLKTCRTFTQNCLRRNTTALDRCLKRQELETFDAILVNYAWLLPSVLRRHPKRPLLICDSHDVQYLRSFGENPAGPDWIARYLAEKGKRRELGLLRRADQVLAISQRDHDVLSGELDVEKVVLAMNGFDYVAAQAREMVASRPLRFGFIGGPMEANELAVSMILENWWPAILAWAPGSQLTIAGAISRKASIRRYAEQHDSVHAAGFVPSLPAFYAETDVLLSPVLLAGGLNFKNAEAIAAGVTLVTNQLGAEALGDLDVRVAEDGEEVVAHLREIQADPAGDLARRQELQAGLKRLYDVRPAIERIFSELPSGACDS